MATRLEATDGNNACDICPLQAVSVLGSRDPACPGPGDHAARQRSAHSSAAPWRYGRGTQSRGGSLDGHYVAPARSVTAKVPGIIMYSTEAPPPKSLEVEPGRLVKMTHSLNDIWIM